VHTPVSEEHTVLGCMAIPARSALWGHQWVGTELGILRSATLRLATHRLATPRLASSSAPTESILPAIDIVTPTAGLLGTRLARSSCTINSVSHCVFHLCILGSASTSLAVDSLSAPSHIVISLQCLCFNGNWICTTLAGNAYAARQLYVPLQ